MTSHLQVRERERERERGEREINIIYTFVDQKDCHYVENAKTATTDHNYQDLNSTANTGMYCRFIVVPFEKSPNLPESIKHKGDYK